MSKVLFFNISGHRLGVRLFLAPPRRSDRGGDRRRLPQVEKDPSRQEYIRPEVKYFIDLLVGIEGSQGAINWTQTFLKGLESKSVNVQVFESLRSSLEEVISKGNQLLGFLKKENSSLPEDLKYHAKQLLEQAEKLITLLKKISPQDVQNLHSRIALQLEASNRPKDLPGLVTKALQILEAVVKEIKNL